MVTGTQFGVDYQVIKMYMPLLAHNANIPKSYYFPQYFPRNYLLCKNNVLKPLFSFAGKGVNL